MSLKISIVTPSYNQGEFIEDTILSIRNQNYKNYEHIVMDGGSSDTTVEIFKKYPEIKWTSAPDKGQTNAANKAIKASRGEIIGWINSDDLYCEDIFQKVSKIFENDPSLSVIYGDYIWIDKDGNFIKKIREASFNVGRLCFSNFIAHPTVFLRKEVIDDLGLFREDLHFSMDYEYWIRICKSGKYKVKHVPIFLAKIRFHPDAKTYLHREKQNKDRKFIVSLYKNFFVGRNSIVGVRAFFYKKYYTFYKQFLEFRSNPVFFLKKIFFNAVSLVTFGKIKTHYKYSFKY
ncbi:glycosyl transferase family 2 [Candidatus Omnitrophus magneticus]|uniref:Glycosyl transferase family 2 n=1 Tax=Candidatus Omnitrophus magneticus TaxID=1609969 RepID=A0A0F0CUQ7_9BACT|nr:glycosyl transferase family 2 [Candidatus Omnitrophus magneticus]